MCLSIELLESIDLFYSIYNIWINDPTLLVAINRLLEKSGVIFDHTSWQNW